jgi:hypothetical protein
MTEMSHHILPTQPVSSVGMYTQTLTSSVDAAMITANIQVAVWVYQQPLTTAVEVDVAGKPCQN